MSAVERAAEVILHGRTLFVSTAMDSAQALSDAGLLLSDADRAVLDAARAWAHAPTRREEHVLAASLRGAVFDSETA